MVWGPLTGTSQTTRKNVELVRIVKQRKAAYLGHVLRHGRHHLLHTIMMGKVDGTRKVGRRNMSWLRKFREWTMGQLFSSVRFNNGEAPEEEIKLALLMH